MRASVLLAAAAVAGMFALPGSASAQVGVYVGPADDGYYYGEPGYPRVYRSPPNYYNEDDGDDGVAFGYAPVLPYPRGGCGTYHYWDGFRCVDARRK